MALLENPLCTHLCTRRLIGRQNTRVSAGFEEEIGAAEKTKLRSVLPVFRQMLPGVMGLNKHHCVPNCVPIGMGHPTP